MIYPRLSSTAAAPIPYGFQITSGELPRAYTPGGKDIFANGTKAVPANTVMDVDRFEQDLAALSPAHQITPLTMTCNDPAFGNAYLQTWTLGLERHFGDLVADATYIGTAAVKLARESYWNGYNGASESFAPYTQFDQAGNIVGGFGSEAVVTSTAHSSYHALQTSLQGTVAHGGPGVQASYTWSKSLDETSAVVGGFVTGGTGAILQTSPQNPFDTHPEKGPSTFDVAHTFTLSLAQEIHGENVAFLRPLGNAVIGGWELLSISSINSGAPFTVYSGVQQTGAGTIGSDRPDQIGIPHLSTSRKIREDYFGLGANNASYFSIPINVPGGSGPNDGRFGTLGRNTFRGPAYYDFDFALIKNTPFGRRSSGIELAGSAVSRRVLQPIQHRQYGIAGQHSAGSRLWGNQPHGRYLPANPILFEAHLLEEVSPLPWPDKIATPFPLSSREPVTFSIFSHFVHRPDVFSVPLHKAVILSEAPRRSIA